MEKRAHAGRIPGLDGIRGIAVLMVVASHAFRSTGRFGVPLARLGFVGVTIFFVLSGYLITRLLLDEESRTGRVSLRRFYGRRLLRIQPPAFAYLIFVVLLAKTGCVEIASRDIWSAILPVRNFFYGSPLTQHFWSLSIEEQFYLAWPLIFFLVRQSRWRLALTVLPVTFGPVLHRLLRTEHGGGFFRTDLWCDGLLTGCGLAIARSLPLYARALTAAGRSKLVVLASIVTVELQFFRESFGYAQILLPTLGLIAIALLVNAASQQIGVLDSSPLRWLGRISYSLYLWQQLAFFGLPDSMSLAVRFAFALAAAAASQHWIERPCDALRRALRLRRRSVSSRSGRRRRSVTASE
jgi:peptidoglycan/LPS O-acetylase OafA/YrhL